MRRLLTSFSIFAIMLLVTLSVQTAPVLAAGTTSNTYSVGSSYEVTAGTNSGVLNTYEYDNSTGTTRVDLIREPVSVPQGFATDIGELLNAILSWVMVLAALLVFFYLVWGGFTWITSGGDKGKTDKAKEMIKSAVIGIIIVAASFAVVNLVVRFLGFNSFNDVLNNVRPING